MPSGSSKPQRTCLGCRQVIEQEELVRYVMAPGGEVVVDYRRRLPGRGAYTHISRDCILAAAKRQQFDRAFKGKNQKVAGESLLEALAGEIRGRVLNLLGMARKSGQAISGGNLVLDSLSSSGVAFVLLAGDVSEGIGQKVLGRAGRAGILCERFSDKALLGQILGKGERSVVALKSGTLAETVMKELFRYKQIAGES